MNVMRELGIRGVRRGRTPVTTKPAKGTGGRPDLVERGFEAEAPNRLHVADITYVRMANGSFGYTAFAADVFARRIVGWACATTMDTRELPLQALEQAMSWAASHGGTDGLAHHTGEGLRAFMRRTAPNRRFLALFDPSPVVADIDDETFGEMVEYRPVWSCNEREAVLIAGRLGLPMHQGTFRTLIERMARRLDSALIVRVGKGGAWLARPGAEAELVAGFPVHAIDTNGAGDCHAGVLCAELSRGTGLREAVGIANAAAAIAVTRRGPATCPSRIEVEKLLAMQTL